MGVLTDFVIADVVYAKLVGDTSNPSKEFAGLDTKGIDHVKLSTLYSILTNTSYNPNFMMAEASLLYSASDDGPWVQLVPQDMVARLSQLNDQNISTIAAAWAKTEEFDAKYGHWELDSIEALLRELIALARQAVARNKALLMWTSL